MPKDLVMRLAYRLSARQIMGIGNAGKFSSADTAFPPVLSPDFGSPGPADSRINVPQETATLFSDLTGYEPACLAAMSPINGSLNSLLL
jgi:hypothetical protein